MAMRKIGNKKKMVVLCCAAALVVWGQCFMMNSAAGMHVQAEEA